MGGVIFHTARMKRLQTTSVPVHSAMMDTIELPLQHVITAI